MSSDAAKPARSKASPAPSEPGAHEPLEFTVQSTDAVTTQRADVLLAGVFADGSLSPAADAIDAASKGRLQAWIKRGDLAPKAGSTLLLYDLPGIATNRLMIVSLGERSRFGERAYFDALAGAAKALSAGRSRTAFVTLADIDIPGRSTAWRVQNASRILADGAYRFDAPKAQSNGNQPQGAKGANSITLLISDEVTPEILSAAGFGQAIAEGMALTRDLGNLPGNICNPTYLADTATRLGKELKFDVDILEREDMAKLGMGSALSVGRASDQPCKFIVMKYSGATGDAKPIVLIGKGVTFDTGGISLKPGDDLDMMKYDMCGAAAVIGIMKTVARLKLPMNLVGIVCAVENMPGGNATRPGDVVRSMSGQTIEILNTDAEGRLVLCDALTYAERFNPECVIDVATLTGAVVIALGSQTSGLYSNDDALASELFAAGTDSGDRAWRMPLWDEYQEQLKSNFADMSNLGGRPAGSVTAACFLWRFAGGYRWAHLDIAGTASVGGDAKGATGRPVPLLSEFLIRRSARSSGSARPSA